MLKKFLPIIAVIVIIIAGTVYLLSNSQKQAINSNTQPVNSTTSTTQTENNSQLSELSDDWQTYTSNEWGFSINHPADVKIELTQNGVHFLNLGDTQATGTELFDGLSLLIFSAKLPNKTFDEFVKQEYQKIKNEPVYESVSELQSAQVSTYSGYKFIATGIGTSTTYFLKNGPDGFIKIIDMTVEPSNKPRDFHKTVEQMLNTLQVHAEINSEVTNTSE